MNRRSFFARCLAGAVLGLARNLPMPVPPAEIKTYQIPWDTNSVYRHSLEYQHTPRLWTVFASDDGEHWEKVGETDKPSFTVDWRIWNGNLQ